MTSKLRRKLIELGLTIILCAIISAALLHALRLPLVALDNTAEGNKCVYVQPSSAGTCANLPLKYSTIYVDGANLTNQPSN